MELMHSETQEELGDFVEYITRMGFGFIQDNCFLKSEILPVKWFKHIRYENGKPNTLAICVLAYLISSCLKSCPFKMTEEGIPSLCLENYAFYMTYKQISESLFISEKQAKDAVLFLEHLGLLKRILKTVSTKYGRLGNVLYIQLNSSKIREITYDHEG